MGAGAENPVGEGATLPDLSVRTAGWTVLVVDDHDGFRVAARRLLEAAGFVVVGEAADGAAALAAAARLAPDVVVLDIQLPDLDGFDVARQLAAGSLPAPAVVLVSTRGASSYRLRLDASPVLGFLSKPDLTGAALLALLAGKVRTEPMGGGT